MILNWCFFELLELSFLGNKVVIVPGAMLLEVLSFKKKKLESWSMGWLLKEFIPSLDLIISINLLHFIFNKQVTLHVKKFLREWNGMEHGVFFLWLLNFPQTEIFLNWIFSHRLLFNSNFGLGLINFFFCFTKFDTIIWWIFLLIGRFNGALTEHQVAASSKENLRMKRIHRNVKDCQIVILAEGVCRGRVWVGRCWLYR